jgi:hypothetical protein
VRAIVARGKRKNNGTGQGRTRRAPEEFFPHPPVEESPRHLSATAVAAEALRSGILPSTWRCREAIPHETDRIRVGDPDDDALANEYVGENTPGGSTSTPDQNDVDEIGRVYGLQEEDIGELRSSGEVLGRRDRRRFELRPPRRPRS